MPEGGYAGGGPPMGGAGRTPEQIRASIEQNREQLGVSLEKLRVEVVELHGLACPCQAQPA